MVKGFLLRLGRNGFLIDVSTFFLLSLKADLGCNCKL